ncbi:MAG: acyltransferase [Deltaproteobacteria bacterium]|nr:acyltransferase [Deltaproteobacteria bacterium]
MAWYECLSAEDRSFLLVETPHAHMHVGGATMLELGALATPQGGLDMEQVRRYIAAHLHLMPRYRQRLAYVPAFDRPVWVDDDHFNLAYHVRHVSVPRPGDDRQFKRLTGQIMSQPLDRGRPLWELWFVEGLKGGRWGLVMKTHHCMVDGVSGVNLLSVLLRPSRDATVPDAPRWRPRPIPAGAELLRDEMLRRATLPLQIGRGLLGVLRDPKGRVAELTGAAAGMWNALRKAIDLPSETPINGPIGPYRRCDWFTLELDHVKTIKRRLGGTVNDVIVAAITGGCRRFFERRGIALSGMNVHAVVPVNIRTPAERQLMGNRISVWVLALPLQTRDPVERLHAVSAATAQAKASHEAAGSEFIFELASAIAPIFQLGMRMAEPIHPYNLIVSNVMGPGEPMYFAGAQSIEGYPMVPLFENQGVAIGSFSNVGKLFFGFNADWELLPDLHDLVEAIRLDFAELHQAARHGAYTLKQGKRPPRGSRRPPRARP